MAQAALSAPDAGFHDYMAEAAAFIEATRPTAQNLFYAVRRVMRAVEACGDDIARAREAMAAVIASYPNKRYLDDERHITLKFCGPHTSCR